MAKTFMIHYATYVTFHFFAKCACLFSRMRASPARAAAGRPGRTASSLISAGLPKLATTPCHPSSTATSSISPGALPSSPEAVPASASRLRVVWVAQARSSTSAGGEKRCLTRSSPLGIASTAKPSREHYSRSEHSSWEIDVVYRLVCSSMLPTKLALLQLINSSRKSMANSTVRGTGLSGNSTR
jgi:hypothetical protein